MLVAALDKRLSDHRKRSTHHVAVFFPKWLENATVEDVADATFNTWKIGQLRRRQRQLRTRI